MIEKDNRIISIISNENLLQQMKQITILGVVGNKVIAAGTKDADNIELPVLFFAIDHTNGEIVWSKKIYRTYFTNPFPILDNSLIVTQSWTDDNFDQHSQVQLIDINTGKTRKRITLPVNDLEDTFGADLSFSNNYLYVHCLGHDSAFNPVFFVRKCSILR